MTDLQAAAPVRKTYFTRGAPPKIRTIQRVVAEVFGVTTDDLCGPSRKAGLIPPRHLAMFFARELAESSYPRIGKMFGGRDHTTVLSAVRNVQCEMIVDDPFAARVQDLRAHIAAALHDG